MTTAQVAAAEDCDMYTAQKWAKAHGVAKPAHDYAWTEADVEEFRRRPQPGRRARKDKKDLDEMIETL
jgi:hypothetical protein